jgi:hypothetical protein
MTKPQIDEADYIKAFMSERPVELARAALIVIDMQYATGHRDGALGRRLTEGRVVSAEDHPG